MMKQKTLLILVLFSLFLISTLVNAQTSCDEYCSDSVYYGDGEYNARTQQCDYSITRCESGCNVVGIGCVVTESVMEYKPKTCDPHCEEGVYYGRGIYNQEIRKCEYQYRNRCGKGCNVRGTECYQSEAIEMFCSDYCSDDTYYYSGSYGDETRGCKYRGKEVCRYGCDLRQSNCAEPGQVIEYIESIEKTCKDSDKGIDFEEKGKVLWVYGNEEGTLQDHCVSGSTLVEYYCDDQVRAAAYKECSEDEMLCKDAKCVKFVKGDCIDSDGDDVTTNAWADGTNIWNEGLVSWGDYCTETPEGVYIKTGDYVHEAICLETSDGYYEVRYAEAQKCKDGCVDGICIRNGKAKKIEEETNVCSPDCSCMTRKTGAEKFPQFKMCRDIPCDFVSDGTAMYCIKNETEKVITRRKISASLKSELGIEEKGNEYLLEMANKFYKVKNPEEAIVQYVKIDEYFESINVTLEKDKPVYELRKERKARLFGFIHINMKIASRINALNNELIEEEIPWWSFLAKINSLTCGDEICTSNEHTNCIEDCGSLCGNNNCDPSDFEICPEECGSEYDSSCGNGICEVMESQETCSYDCYGECGNGKYDDEEGMFGENPCPHDINDLPPVCGDGKLNWNEDLNSDVPCVEDICGGCGDGICKGSICGENPDNCPYDCSGNIVGGCGDGICSPGETPDNCPYDCGSNCGNLVCEGTENYQNCFVDCGFASDGICVLEELKVGGCEITLDCCLNTKCGNSNCDGGESVKTCPADCGNCFDCNCGNNVCDIDENVDTCPGDCSNSCGDGICNVQESILSCSQDCSNSCGDNICTEKDLKDGCETDCSIVCGDGQCLGVENSKNCEEDCPLDIEQNYSEFYGIILGYDGLGFCGDNLCNNDEDQKNCYQDCQSLCGDGVCGLEEDYSNCKLDCGKMCGDGICLNPENPDNCPLDCKSFCGDNLCNKGEWPQTCPLDCGHIICGDEVCDNGENPDNCPLDCNQSICGNVECEYSENPTNCPFDCGTVCGDNKCLDLESYLSCPWDCGYCGDGVCSIEEKELCIFDCTSACGNGICEKDESGVSCPYDCVLN